MEASDGHSYVVKFHNNPQHRRILVNEWIASTFLHYLGIAAPEVAMVQITESFLAGDPETYIQLGRERRAVTPGLALRLALSRAIRRAPWSTTSFPIRCSTRSRICPIFAPCWPSTNGWAMPTRGRPSSFARGCWNPWPREPRRLGFVAQMVDNGYVFEGPHWRLGESAIQGLYFRPLVYRTVRGLAEFEPWLDRIRNFPEEVVDQAVKRIPPAWLEGDEDELERLLERLMRRRARVPDLIEQCRSGRSNPFPNWRP